MFKKRTPKTPTNIGKIEYTIIDNDGTVGNIEMSVTVEVLDDTGQIYDNANVNNAIPMLSQMERKQLLSLLIRLRRLAETKLL